MRESDWAALADVQFILYNRIANQLNEALSGIALSDMPEASGKPAGYWKDRAVDKITNVLNMFTAWTWLIRYKSGESIPQRAIRPFETNALLAWLGRQLQLNPPPKTNMNPLLQGNQETLQEALLLLYSVAYTQGGGVRLAFEATKLGTWFRVRYDRSREIPADIDALIASFGDHWRDQDAVFELSTARDFVRLNGCTLALNSTETGGEFAFFVRAAGARTVAAPPKTSAKVIVETSAVDTLPLEQSVALPVTREPGQTRPLDPNALALYLDRRGIAETEADVAAAAQKSGIDPVVKTASETGRELASDDTPSGIVPPTLAELRPFDPAVRAQMAQKAEQQNPIDSALEPETPAQPESRREMEADTVILRAKIPAPQLPERLRKPPAATSNVALTRDTQTFTAVDLKAARSVVDSYESDDSAACRDRHESHDHMPVKEDNG